MTEFALKNFRNYGNRGPFQMALLTYVVTSMLTNSELDLYKEVFFYMNTSYTGNLTRVEILQAFWNFGYSEVGFYEVDMVFSLIDEDSSGMISFNEFLLTAVNPLEILSRERLNQAFKEIDVSGDNTISLEELK